ncbi:MAG: transcriptional repressor [Bacteroidales bacterium]|nr:transcriptional repressor [Bacteroidales bacterium]
MADKNIIRILTENGLRVTPQRTAILEAIMNLHTHPTADDIVQYLRSSHTNIPHGTVYKILDKFVTTGIIQKVKTDGDLLRYDAVKARHHHLYSSVNNSIEDFYDDELDKILSDYFEKKEIPGFIVEDFKLQIIGKRENNPENKRENNPGNKRENNLSGNTKINNQ